MLDTNKWAVKAKSVIVLESVTWGLVAQGSLCSLLKRVVSVPFRGCLPAGSFCLSKEISWKEELNQLESTA